jgi:N6-adenosine-specific RNA methylase IME4
MNLVKYDAACRALAEAKTLVEITDIRNWATAARVYAKQAKNKELEADAVEIRMRATRRVDEMIEQQRETVGLAQGRRSDLGSAATQVKATLAEVGVDKNLAHQARVLGRLSEKAFEAAVARAREAINRIVRIETDRTTRLANIAAILAGNYDLSLARKYPIIYADPPWRYENPPIGATGRSIENHYPTLSVAEICELPVDQLAHDDAMLYLWATAPKLAECMEVIKAWGFEYRTCLVWDKEIIGMGYYARNQHELLLVARRGDIPPPEAGTQPTSVHRERRGEHSVKPVFYYEIIEAAYPGLPKIELFARSERDGWDRWGNES